MFNFDLDKERRLLVVTKSGFWDEAATGSYQNDLAVALSRLAQCPRPTRCLLDQGDMPVQSPSYIEAMRTFFERSGLVFPDKTASVIPGALAKMQDNRLTGEKVIGAYAVFATRNDAMQWLLSDSTTDQG